MGASERGWSELGSYVCVMPRLLAKRVCRACRAVPCPRRAVPWKAVALAMAFAFVRSRSRRSHSWRSRSRARVRVFVFACWRWRGVVRFHTRVALFPKRACTYRPVVRSAYAGRIRSHFYTHALVCLHVYGASPRDSSIHVFTHAHARRYGRLRAPLLCMHAQVSHQQLCVRACVRA